MFGAYIHTRPNDSIFYVGKGLLKRAMNLAPALRNQHHGRIVAKEGKENIGIGYIECSSEGIAFELEKGLIKCLRRNGVKLTNLTDGGDGASGNIKSEETKRKIAEKRLGWRHTQEVKDRISRLKKGCPAVFKGRTHTEVSKELNRIAHLGKKHTEESCKKMSLSRTGDKNHMYGKNQTESAKEKQRAKALARPKKECKICGVIMPPANLAQHITRKHTLQEITDGT